MNMPKVISKLLCYTEEENNFGYAVLRKQSLISYQAASDHPIIDYFPAHLSYS